MHLNRTVVAVAASAALVLSAIPAHAQRRGDDHGRRGSGGHEARAHAEPRGNAAPRSTARGAEAPRQNVARPYASYGYRGERDHDRGYDYRGGYNYRGGYGSHRSFFSYYSFRPRLNLGFGLWVGYPVAYSNYYYYDPYEYAAPYPADSYAYQEAPPPSDYPDSASTQYGDASQPAAAGGVSFEITPENAAVFVDGTYVGTAATFSPTAQPLGLTPGRHRIDIRAEGYRTLTFDADVTAGQVLPYRGTLER